jgi:hypothetical protein
MKSQIQLFQFKYCITPFALALKIALDCLSLDDESIFKCWERIRSSIRFWGYHRYREDVSKTDINNLEWLIADY